MAKVDGTAVAARKGTALVSWEQQLAARAAVAKATEDSVALGQFFGVRAGQLSFAGSPIPGNKMSVVILDHILENKFYLGEFDPDVPQGPACYAFGRSDKELAPHEKASQPQHETCAGCDKNEFGSAEKGRGKACKNSRRLFCLPADALKTAQTVADASGGYLSLPVTSVRGWAQYVNSVAEVLHKPPLGVITEVAVVPDPKSQFKVTFRTAAEIKDGKLIHALLTRAELVEKEIAFPYAETEQYEDVKGKGGVKRKVTPLKQARR